MPTKRRKLPGRRELRASARKPGSYAVRIVRETKVRELVKKASKMEAYEASLTLILKNPHVDRTEDIHDALHGSR